MNKKQKEKILAELDLMKDCPTGEFISSFDCSLQDMMEGIEEGKYSDDYEAIDWAKRQIKALKDKKQDYLDFIEKIKKILHKK